MTPEIGRKEIEYNDGNQREERKITELKGSRERVSQRSIERHLTTKIKI